MKKIVGLIGYPLGHSISPAMHNAAFQKLGLDFEYELFEVESEELSDAVNGMRALHIAGFNVTIPHKENIVTLLDEVTKLPRLIGAVNTVLNQEGKLVGYNTDGPGFIDSLKEDAGFIPQNKNCVVLGSGGAGRAIAIMLAEANARSVTVADVLEDKAKELASYAGSLLDTKFQAVAVNSAELQKAISSANLLVNSTPLGMHPKVEKSPLSENIVLPSKLLVYDLVYNPSETKLLKAAKAAGCKTCGGLGMLVRQGALAFSIWTGEEAPLDIMFAAARKAL